MSDTSAPGRKRSAPITAVAVLIIAALSVIVWLATGGGDDPGSTGSAASSTARSTAALSPGTTSRVTAPPQTTSPQTTSRRTATPGTSRSTATAGGVPAHALATLELIDAGQWPEAADSPGTRGGGTFRNNEGLLPRTGSDGRRLRFREWDVNPKKPGRGRDAERIITADDGSAWYTDDHYRSFTQIRGPN